MLRITGFLAAVALSASACPANAFNTYNGTYWPICVTSGDHGGYREVVQPRSTSSGWAIDASMNLAVSVFDKTVCNDEGVCFMTCNSFPSESSCTTAPHTQQIVALIHFPFDPQTYAGQEASFLAGEKATFTLECNQ